MQEVIQRALTCDSQNNRLPNPCNQETHQVINQLCRQEGFVSLALPFVTDVQYMCADCADKLEQCDEEQHKECSHIPL